MTLHIATPVPADATWLAIRPERVIIGEVDAPNRLSGVVVQRSYAGETLTHVVRLPMAACCAPAALRQGLNAVQVEIGDAVTLSWQPDACIVLAQ